jgi:hypothetical protein
MIHKEVLQEMLVYIWIYLIIIVFEGIISGLNVLRIINEPVAAILAYGLDKKKDREFIIFFLNSFRINVLVIDYGGGPLNVSIVSLDDGIFEIKSTAENIHVGGFFFFFFFICDVFWCFCNKI